MVNFREICTSYLSWNGECRIVRIFAISVFLPEICKIFILLYFLTVQNYLRIFLTKMTPFKELFMLNSEPLKFLRYLLPFQRYMQKCFISFNSAVNLLDKSKNVHVGLHFSNFYIFYRIFIIFSSANTFLKNKIKNP